MSALTVSGPDSLVYAVQWRKNDLASEGWKLDSLHRSRRLALHHILEYWDNDPRYDFKIEEHSL